MFTTPTVNLVNTPAQRAIDAQKNALALAYVLAQAKRFENTEPAGIRGVAAAHEEANREAVARRLNLIK